MYATRVKPTVPLGMRGSHQPVKRVAYTPAASAAIARACELRVYRFVRDTYWYGLLFFYLASLLAGFVTASCLDHTFGPAQTGYNVEIDNAVVLDTSEVNDRRGHYDDGEGVTCINCDRIGTGG